LLNAPKKWRKQSSKSFFGELKMPTKEKFEVYQNGEHLGHILIPIHDIPKNSQFWDVVREKIVAGIAEFGMGMMQVDHVDFGGKIITVTET
jgi:hypothetical protein